MHEAIILRSNSNILLGFEVKRSVVDVYLAIGL